MTYSDKFSKIFTMESSMQNVVAPSFQCVNCFQRIPQLLIFSIYLEDCYAFLYTYMYILTSVSLSIALNRQPQLL